MGTAGHGHGWAKLTGFAERALRFADPIGLGPPASFTLVVFAEVFCAALVAAGLLTRLATVPILIFLLVAAFVQHLPNPWPKKELPLLYLVAFLAILLLGPGRYSLDAWWAGKRRARASAEDLTTAHRTPPAS